VLVLVLPSALGGVAIGILVADLRRDLVGVELLACAVFALLLAVVSSARLAVPRRIKQAVAIAPVLALGMVLGTLRASSATLPTGPRTVSGLAGSPREIAISGTVLDDPRPRADRQQVVLESMHADGRSVEGRLLAWMPRAFDLGTGDRVAFKAHLEEPQDFDGFAYRAFLARQGIGAIARTFNASVVEHQTGGLPGAAARVRATLVEGLNTIVPEPEASLGAGILLGVRTSIDPAVSAAFATAGLTHVVAISGWNIAIVGALVARLLEPMRRRAGGRLLVEPVTALAIGGYVVLVGSSPSVIRAALMAGALMLGRQAGSRAHAASALMLAALAMLLVAPAVLWDVGFQLSLLATAGLIAFGAAIERRLGDRWPAWLREPVALTLAAQLTTLPVILATFERVSLVAPLANVVVVPLVPLVMLASAVAAAAGVVGSAMPIPLLSDALAWFAGGSAWLGLRLMILAGSGAAGLPLAAVPVALPGWLALVWYPVLALLWRRANRVPSEEPAANRLTPLTTVRRSRARVAIGGLAVQLGHLITTLANPWRALLLVTAILAVTTLATLPDGRLHLIALDVGQGDAILLVSPEGRSVLVDSGPDPDQTLRQLGASMPWWRRTIDTIILTHPHQDHVGGFPEVLRRFRVAATLDGGRSYPNPSYDRFLELSRAEPGSRYFFARAGQRLDLDARTSLQIWYPSDADAASTLPAGDINNASVVGLLRVGRFSALLTGDAESPVEELLASRSLLRRVDVLKVGHHGSHSGTTPGFLAVVHPSIALISVGADNRYGHPAPSTIRALEASGAKVLRTDLNGAIEVRTDGASWTVSTHGMVVAGGLAGGSAKASVLPPLRDQPLDTGALRTPGVQAASMPGWPFQTPKRLDASWPRAGFPMGSSSIRRAWPASRKRRPAGWRNPASQSTWASSRSPPCCTTSTSSRREEAEGFTG